jgi:hypothetical protein
MWVGLQAKASMWVGLQARASMWVGLQADWAYEKSA